MTTNSSVSIAEVHSLYSSSSDLGDWIQDPISLLPYDGTLELSTIDGIYVQARQANIFDPLHDLTLDQEFFAWDAASDEALRNFEQDLN